MKSDQDKKDKIGNLALEIEEDENLMFMKNSEAVADKTSEQSDFDTHGKMLKTAIIENMKNHFLKRINSKEIYEKKIGNSLIMRVKK